MDSAAVPFPLRVRVQQAEVFMISIHKQGGKGLVLQPVQLVSIHLLPGPHAAKITRDDHAVISTHSLQMGKILCSEPMKITVGIACDPDAHLVPLLLCQCSSTDDTTMLAQ